jgi:hypothetical protein
MTTYREQYDDATKEAELAVLAAVSAAAKRVAQEAPETPGSSSQADFGAALNNLASAIRTIKAN